MAIQTVNFVKGKIGNVVFYERSGVYIARSIPVHMNQTAGTRKRSSNFGIAGRAGRILRELLAPALPFPKDKQMQRLFQGAIAKWLGVHEVCHLQPQLQLPYLERFNFNAATSLQERFKVKIEVTIIAPDCLQVKIPSFIPRAMINAPAHASSVSLIIAVASTALQNEPFAGADIQRTCIPVIDDPYPGATLYFSVPLQAGSLVLTVASLQFQLQNGVQETRPAFLPASVVDARFPEEQSNSSVRHQDLLMPRADMSIIIDIASVAQQIQMKSQISE